MSWAVAAAQPHAGSEQLPASPQLSKPAEVALNPREGIQQTPVCPSSAALQAEVSQLHTVQPDLLSQSSSPALVPPEGPSLTRAVFRADAQ